MANYCLSQKRIRIEKRHAYDRREKHICCLDLNLAWLPEEVEQVKQLWNDGYAIWEIVERVDRYEMEIAILLMELAEKKKIGARQGGVAGIFMG